MATIQGSVENRGGRREGSGRKRASISNQEVVKLLRAVRLKQKETGKHVYDILADIIYGPKRDVDVRQKIAAIKLYMDSVINHASEREVSITTKQEPSIYLPEQMPDPAKIVAIQGGRK